MENNCGGSIKKFKEYVKKCNRILKETPEAAEFDVLYSKDDEGNRFEHVFYEPSLYFLEDGEILNYEEHLKSPNVVIVN